jgi:hypothetical protein
LSFGFVLLCVQLLEMAQTLSLSLTSANKTDLEVNANERSKKDEPADADERSVVTPEMDPDEV